MVSPMQSHPHEIVFHYNFRNRYITFVQVQSQLLIAKECRSIRKSLYSVRSGSIAVGIDELPLALACDEWRLMRWDAFGSTLH